MSIGMKQIKAVIQPDKFDEVRQALKKLSIYGGLMITEVTGQGAQGGIKQIWRGEKFQMDIIPKVCIDMVVNDSDVELAIDTIVKHARTGEIGDGKIFVYNVEEVVRIRTGERNEQALCPSEADEKLKAIG